MRFYRDPFPTLESGEVLVKLNDLPGLIIAAIGALRLRPLQIFQLNEFVFVSGELSGGFQFCPDFPRHPFAFRVCRRNDQGRLARFHRRSVIRRQRIMSFVSVHFPQHSELVQSLESTFKIAAPQISDHGLVGIGLLPPDFFQFSGGQTGVFFQEAKRVAPFNGAMLRRVTGQDNPAISLFGQIRHARQRADAQKPGLINPNHLTANLRLQFGILQQCLDRFRIGKPGIRPQHPARRFRRRREGKNLRATGFNRGHGFLHHRRLARASAPTNGRDALRALQDVKHGGALFIGQLWVLELVFDRTERLEFPFSIRDEINQPFFFRQHILGGEPLPAIQVFLNQFIPQKLAFGLGHVHIAQAEAQRVPEQFLVGHDGGALVTMLHGKIHRLHFRNLLGCRCLVARVVLNARPFLCRNPRVP